MYMWPSKFVGLTDWTTNHDIQPMNSGFGFGLKMINKCVYIYTCKYEYTTNINQQQSW